MDISPTRSQVAPDVRFAYFTPCRTNLWFAILRACLIPSTGRRIAVVDRDRIAVGVEERELCAKPPFRRRPQDRHASLDQDIVNDLAVGGLEPDGGQVRNATAAPGKTSGSRRKPSIFS